MTLDVDTKEKGLDTVSHNLQKQHAHVTQGFFFLIFVVKMLSRVEGAGPPVKNAPPHGQEGVVHGQSVTHAVAGLDEEGGDGQADQGSGGGGELHVAAQATPGGEDV